MNKVVAIIAAVGTALAAGIAFLVHRKHQSNF